MKPAPAQEWAKRAAAAERAVADRHLRRLWQLPGTQLGVVGWPPTARDRAFGSWHYWWQAHLLDTLVDAHLRDPQPARVQRIRRQIRGHLIRNAGRWTNQYYDDMAWLALALERAGRLVGIERPRALKTLAGELFDSWVPEDGGGIPDRLRRAEQMADWIEATLIDPDTKLVFDGIRGGSLVRAQYTYCQGVVVGLETELAVRTGDDRHNRRVRRLVTAIAGHIAPHGVLRGAGGGDGGLFAGITARYLALAAAALPGRSAADAEARDTARGLVLTSAQSAWDNRAVVDGLPLFGASWAQPAEVPAGNGARARSADGAVHGSEAAERDMSVQISGWMLMEAASAVHPVSPPG